MTFIDFCRDLPEGELIGVTKQLKIDPPKTIFTYIILNEPKQVEKMMKEENNFVPSSKLNSMFSFEQYEYENDFIVQRTEILKILFKHGASPYVSTFQDLQLKTREYIKRIFFQFIKTKWLPVGIALRHLTAHEQMEILKHTIPGADQFCIQKRWQLVTSIKHWK